MNHNTSMDWWVHVAMGLPLLALLGAFLAAALRLILFIVQNWKDHKTMIVATTIAIGIILLLAGGIGQSFESCFPRY